MFWCSVKQIVKKCYSPKYLIVTNTMTGVVSISIGDSIQQYIEYLQSVDHKQTQFHLNQQRSLRMMSAGIYFGLFGHVWYSFLDRTFPGRQKTQIIKKLVSEMAIGPPLVSGVFFVIGKLKANSFEKSWTDLKSNFALICTVEWCVYIPLQYANFSLLPPHLRYLFVATISIGYDAFLSYILHRNERYKKINIIQIQDNLESS